ncbi:formylglycine-generating enzyme family protein [Hymenobacter properus]|uniref:formylglycine-generating enzyme family protein n=1 Tax=Hymenobacter properus TaxID=2791026 RepID=UPI001B82A896|nr:SUMF1/EgtB/PvdO family nonheme iron enzyme [Hymenobacter properus]MBR7722991.1 SUMF1/EgtB/PvdO family nonheme iron enzyme [Microvirga sp. SRT04]
MNYYKRLLSTLVLLATVNISGAAQTRLELLRSVNAPGVVLVQDSLFMDEAEVANIHWLEYLAYLRKDSSFSFYQSQLPDTTALTHWIKAQSDSVDDVYVQYYLRYPGFRYFPLVGVAHKQAVNYCRWRTAKVQEGYLQSHEFKKKHRKLLQQYDVAITYRLPTVGEWEAAASGGLNAAVAPFGIMRPPALGTRQYRLKHIRRPDDFYACLHKQDIPFGKDDQLYQMEFNVHETAYVGNSLTPFRCGNAGNLHHHLNDGFEITDYIYSNPPNGYGLFNMVGNVAELTATPGIAKGGSFGHSIEDFTLKTDFPYDGPCEWLGFRCACTIELRRKSEARQ